MNKLFKSFITLCLLVVATLVFVPSIFAAITGSSTGSITVNDLENGVTVHGYKVIDVNIEDGQPKQPVYTWEPAVAAWMDGNATYKTYVDPTTKEVTKTFTDLANGSSALAKFYDALAGAIKDGTITGLPALTEQTAGADKKVTFSDVPMGNYIIITENGLKVYKPLSANVVPKFENNEWNVENGEFPIEGVTMDAKSSTPDIDKTVKEVGSTGTAKDELQTKIGTVLEYSIEVDIPKYPENAIYKDIIISDTLSKGLTYDSSTFKVYDAAGNDITSVFTAYTTQNSNGFIIEIKKTEAADNYATVFIDENGDLKYESIKVVYQATVNADAEIGTENINDAKLQYNNKPYTSKDYKTKEDEVPVYTYGIKINKKGIDEDANGLAGVKFEISKGSDKFCFEETATTGEYVYTGVATSGSCTKGSTEVTTREGGKLVLKGLDEGVYNATETFAPNGYVRLQAPLQFTIQDLENGDLDGQLTAVEAEVTADGGYVIRDVLNNKGVTLPVTGGIGTLIFSVLGILFMGVAAFLIKSIIGNKKVENN